MPNQANIQDAILNGDYKLATLVNNNLTLINSGGVAIKEPFITFFKLSIKGLTYRYDVADYTSSTAITLYDRVTALTGIPASATIDPNFQAPNTTIIIEATPDNVQSFIKSEADLIDDGFGGYYLPFLNGDDQPFAVGVVPIQLTVDGVGLALQPNYSFDPMRLYGFANNATQTIILTVI